MRRHATRFCRYCRKEFAPVRGRHAMCDECRAKRNRVYKKTSKANAAARAPASTLDPASPPVTERPFVKLSRFGLESRPWASGDIRMFDAWGMDGRPPDPAWGGEMNPALFSSASSEWATPQWLFDGLNRRFQFTLDPCCTAENAKCSKYFTKVDNGLIQSWQGERVFMNPPFSRKERIPIEPWVRKAREEAEAGALVVGLLPVRPDVQWWRSHVNGHADLRYVEGRLKFGGLKEAAPFPSAIVLWWGWPVLAGGFVE